MSLLAICMKHDTAGCRECFPLPQWADIADVKELESERDALKAEVEILKRRDCEWSDKYGEAVAEKERLDSLWSETTVELLAMTKDRDRLKSENDWLKKQSVIVHEVSQGDALKDRDRWRTLAEGAKEIFKEMAGLSYFDKAEGPELRAQNQMLHRLSANGLRAFEAAK